MSAGKVREGSLAECDFADLVQELYEKRWNGALTLTHRGLGRRINVQDGRMVFASSSDPDDRLGELLLRQGRIALRQFTLASRSVAPGRRLGAILVEQGVLSPKELVKAVIDHNQEIIYGAFQWIEGHYRLDEGSLDAEAITLKLSTPDLILEGIRRIQSWGRVARAVGGLDAVYARTEDYERVIAYMTLSFEKLSILTGLHEPRTVGAICEESGVSDFETCKALWAFRVVGAVQRRDPAAAAAPRDEDDGLGVVLAGE